jgi:hypothetical protein
VGSIGPVQALVTCKSISPYPGQVFVTFKSISSSGKTGNELSRVSINWEPAMFKRKMLLSEDLRVLRICVIVKMQWCYDRWFMLTVHG